MPDPIFPLEIEHIIATTALALRDRKESALNLLLVARRFHSWLLPELLRTLVIRTIPKSAVRWPCIETLREYGKHTRNLFFWTSDDQFKQYFPENLLEFFPNLVNLLFWSDIDALLRTQVGHQHQHHHHDLYLRHLTHLSITLDDIPTEIPVEAGVLLSRITHLETTADVDSDKYIRKLKRFKSLTHLVVPESTEFSFLSSLFPIFPHLEVVVSLIRDSSRPLGPLDEFDASTDDPRIVKMTWHPEREEEEWLLDVENGRGMWGLADEIVMERKRLGDELNRK